MVKSSHTNQTETVDAPQKNPHFIGKLQRFFPPDITLFAVLFACVLRFIDVRLIFQARDKLFLWNHRYFTDFIGQPKLLLEWMDSLLVQLCYSGWPGILAFSTLLWILLTSTASLMNKINGGKTIGTWMVPAVAIVWLYSDYSCHTSILVGLTLAAFATNLWFKTVVQKSGLRISLFFLLAMALYYVAGATALLCFSACAFLYAVGVERRIRIGGLLALCALLAKFGTDAFLSSAHIATRNVQPPALRDFLAAEPMWPEILLYAYFPLCTFIVIAWCRADNKGLFKKKSGQKKKPAALAVRLRWAAGMALVLLAAAAGLIRLDREQKALLALDYYSEHRQWDQVLKNAAKLSDKVFKESYANHAVNRALYYKGRLPYDLLNYKQSENWMLVDGGQLNSECRLFRIPIDFHVEIGRVNEAERLIFPMMEESPSGAAFKRMAWVKMIKNQPDAARIYLNVLRSDLVWGRWAKTYLHRLEVNPSLSGDPDIQRIRQLMIEKDDLMQTVVLSENGDPYMNIPAVFMNQLKQNRNNRMVYEYLMARSLLSCDVRGAASLFPLADNFSYAEIPPLYEEAVVTYGMEHPGEVKITPSGIYFHNRRISDQTAKKYHQLEQIANRCGGFNQETKTAVAKELPGSYFQFYISREIGDE